jgi:hypothetical protein
MIPGLPDFRWGKSKIDRLVLVAKNFWKRNDSASMRRARCPSTGDRAGARSVAVLPRRGGSVFHWADTQRGGLWVVCASEMPGDRLRVGAGVDWHFVAACAQSGIHHALPRYHLGTFLPRATPWCTCAETLPSFPAAPPLEFGWKLAVWVSRVASRPDRSRCGHLDPCQNEEKKSLRPARPGCPWRTGTFIRTDGCVQSEAETVTWSRALRRGEMAKLRKSQVCATRR